jgi:Purple acid Phosphatase, N-terminal domain/Bacterial Ig domain
VPSTSLVELQVGAGAVARSSVDPVLVTSHRIVLTGLVPGTTYRYRARSVSSSGGQGISVEGVFVTTPAGSGPEVSSVKVLRATGTTVALGWTTGTGTAAQIEYGPTANYGSFTLLKVFAQPAQQMELTGLRPGSMYHFRVKSWDGGGFLGSSADVTFVTAHPGLATLVGDQTVQPERVMLPGGQAAAYQYDAAQSGQASVIRLYLDAGTSAPVVRVAIYADQEGAPGALLSQGSAPGLSVGWTSITIPPVSLVEGSRYWISVLSPIGGGNLVIRDAGRGRGTSLLGLPSTLAAFPSAWIAGTTETRAPLSVYAQQVPPSVTLSGAQDGATVTGSVVLSAVVDDDAPIASVQFLVDDVAMGAPLTTAPYMTVLDTAALNAAQPHMILARATDLLGRSAASGMLTVQVDNGPTIEGVVASRGLTASSARISWRTDSLADAQVEFGTTTAYGQTTLVDPRMARNHEMQVTGLVPGTTYHYRVRSRDAQGAVAVSSDRTFATPEP